MSDDETENELGDTGAESGVEIPISTGDDGESADDDETTSDDAAGDDASVDGEAEGEGEGEGTGASENGVEVEVEIGSPGPDVERRSDGSEAGGSGGLGGGLFDRFDESIVTLLSRVLDTETGLRVYIALRRRPWSTAEEIAAEADLYPRAVRDALDALESVGAVDRRGPAGGTDAGDGDAVDEDYEPEYAAVAPSVLVTDAIGDRGRDFPEQLSLDRRPGSESMVEGSEPIRIDVEEGADERNEGNERDESDEQTGREHTDEPNGSEPGVSGDAVDEGRKDRDEREDESTEGDGN